LLGELGIAEGVAGPLQAHDKAISNQLVVPDALNRCHIFDARGSLNLARKQSGEDKENDAEHQ
jgi:hypothetical protein